MALKEIKVRINSVKSTRKITSAMKMVSSAKLHKAQNMIGNMLPYAEALHGLMRSLLSTDFSNPLCNNREVRRVAIIVLSSDGLLCGAFNANIIHETLKAIDDYKTLPTENIQLFTIGKKIFEALREKGYTVKQNFEGLAGKPDYTTTSELASFFIQQFEMNKIDRVELIYHHFKSSGSQQLLRETVLPLILSIPQDENNLSITDYIFEPSREALLHVLIPKSIKLKFYTALLDSNASEHAARMLAMQTATENADDLISELTVEYNKSRQQAITNELLDIIGGAFGR